MGRRERIEWVINKFRDKIKSLIVWENVEPKGRQNGIIPSYPDLIKETQDKIISEIRTEFLCLEKTAYSYLDMAKQKIKKETRKEF